MAQEEAGRTPVAEERTKGWGCRSGRSKTAEAAAPGYRSDRSMWEFGEGQPQRDSRLCQRAGAAPASEARGEEEEEEEEQSALAAPSLSVVFGRPASF